MGFFDAARVPPPPAPPSYRLPEWIAPPENIKPAMVYVDLVLATTRTLTLAIALLEVFPTGIGFELACAGHEGAHPYFHGPPLIDGGLGFGVLFADGRTAIADDGSPRRPFLQRPSAPRLRVVSGGSGSGGGCRTTFWLWPLPPPGPLEFVCEWTLQGIPETGATVGAALLAGATDRCRELWLDERDLPPTEGDVVI
jgi:hypothetical protein